MATIPNAPTDTKQPPHNPNPIGRPTTPHGPRLHVPPVVQPFPEEETATKPSKTKDVPKSAADFKASNDQSETDLAGTTNTAEKTLALKEAIERARKGDESVLPELRKLIADIPSEKTGGDLSKVIINQMIGAQFKNDLYSKEVITRKLSEIRQELSGPKPTPVESLLIGRILCTWLRLHLAELSTGFAEATSKAHSPAMTKSLERLNKQYLAAIKALGDIRKMNIQIQVNVAKRQQILSRTTQEVP